MMIQIAHDVKITFQSMQQIKWDNETLVIKELALLTMWKSVKLYC